MDREGRTGCITLELGDMTCLLCGLPIKAGQGFVVNVNDKVKVNSMLHEDCNWDYWRELYADYD